MTTTWLGTDHAAGFVASDLDLDRIIGDVGHNSPELARRLVEQGWTKPAVES